MIRNLFVFAAFALPMFAFAQDPVTQRPDQPQGQVAPAQPKAQPAAPKGIPLPGSVWNGTEEFNNNGRLAFILAKNGEATMIDAQSTVKGSWSAQGNRVMVRFQNCEYVGTIEGRVMTGQATVTEGKDQGATWKFRIEHADPLRNREFNGKEALAAPFGPLTFQFGDNFEATMIDGKSTVKGSYSLDLDVVTIRFNNCVYVGRINMAERITGMAQYTEGQSQPWSFEVSLRK